MKVKKIEQQNGHRTAQQISQISPLTALNIFIGDLH